MPPRPVARLQAALAGEASDDDRLRPLGIGWGTVELDRASVELAADLGIEPDDFVPSADSAAMGAGTRIARDVLPGGVSIVLLEPVTEGRLAEILARHDEGPAVVWFAAAGPPDPDEGRPAISLDGPFGPERRIATGRLDRLIVEPRPGTIAP